MHSSHCQKLISESNPTLAQSSIDDQGVKSGFLIVTIRLVLKHITKQSDRIREHRWFLVFPLIVCSLFCFVKLLICRLFRYFTIPRRNARNFCFAQRRTRDFFILLQSVLRCSLLTTLFTYALQNGRYFLKFLRTFFDCGF